MPPQFPSIQSFFQASKHSSNKKRSKPVVESGEPGDGFTSEEVDAVLHPKLDTAWTPTDHYDNVDIASLAPGPNRIEFQGRIANLYHQAMPSKRPRAAKGCVKCIIKDDSGAVTVRLWYANLDYGLRLGQLVSIWAPHVSNGEHGTLSAASAPLFVSIFPERDRSCHFMVHENSDQQTLCRTPLGYREGQQLGGLMTLKSFVEGGYDVSDGKILVVVKSIGAKKKGMYAMAGFEITNKKGEASECISINIFDDTADASLTLWGNVAASASPWKASATVLLVTNPGWRIDRKAWISLTANTLIDVDPCISDADWLRQFALRMTRRECVQPVWPAKVAETVEIAKTAENRILFNFADLDSFARSAPQETFFGYLSVLITQLSLILLHRRQMLLCNECCGVPIYANNDAAKCKQCDKTVALKVNPKVLGNIVDETGCVGTGKLVFSDKAWEQLLGRTAGELGRMGVEELKYLEARLLWSRITMCFVWVAEEGEGGMGRLWVWGVTI